MERCKGNRGTNTRGEAFFLYTLTNPNTTQIGIYKITKKQIAFELGYSQETINTLLDLFQNKYKLLRYNNDTKELAIGNWGKYNLDRGGKPMIDCIIKELKEVKDVSLVKYISYNIEKIDIRNIFNDYISFRENNSNNHTGYVSGNHTSYKIGQEEEKEKEQDKEKEKGVKSSARYSGNNRENESTNIFKRKNEYIYKQPTEEQLKRVKELFN